MMMMKGPLDGPPLLRGSLVGLRAPAPFAAPTRLLQQGELQPLGHRPRPQAALRPVGGPVSLGVR